MKRIFILLLVSFLLLFAEPEPISLPFFSKSVSLQVLGSGGVEMGDKRASSSYLIWINEKARILIDFGGGASLRFEEAEAKIDDLDVVLLTNLHAEHTSDLPALLGASLFSNASGELDIYGPSSSDTMPNTRGFINKLFIKNSGAWEYMSEHLGGSAKLQLKTHNIEKTKEPQVIYDRDGIRIIAISPHNSSTPAVAYRVEVGLKSVTFSGDMSGEDIETLAKDSSILVASNSIPKDATKKLKSLHITPFGIGEVAQKARVKSVVLSHRTLQTIGEERETIREVKRNYRGKVEFAEDKSRYLVE